MCTVTIFPKSNNDFVLTSNRDEAPYRKSLAPKVYSYNGIKMLFPKDEISGGTWIGVSEKNRLVCVLNGGFELHKRKPDYRLSRGIIAKDFLASEGIIKTIESYDLNEIEPFTMVIVEWDVHLKFYELVWDGTTRHFSKLPLESKIWSSSTLYDTSMKLERSQWFESFKKEHDLNAVTLLQFHKTAGKDNKDFGVIMDRGFVKTTSITQVKKKSDILEMHYENLQDNIATNSAFNSPQIING